ncbi:MULTISPECIES: thiamine phosphate synthase [Cobetia]|jgi:thiamine-phosphate pyrophosphorylase|uniref:thiamine phosphate synthase n=1 Tax=Cobetia TaxID=204286 RepID=UPI000469C993|nr:MULTISPECIES: thiamine phosphate synthase [Cobetia]MDH2294125.1 thiamine phosphate synthase [Cobetia sp. 1AS1]MDH2297386.1 thiamine phosphate synthase [Cobetia sp. 29-18-1]|tara:strand:+ start:1586 stop:2209 length:624 start_codon:yes stop_codon:yes gene_type:complete
MSLDLSLYLVTDPALCAERGLEATVMAAVRGGVSVVQLRDKHASDEEMIAQAIRLKALLDEYEVPLIINDRIEVALASGADGLHIGQSDGDPVEARRRLGEDALIGLSVQTLEQLKAVDVERIDYLGLGPVYATPTKPDHAAPLGIEGLTQLVRSSPLPTVAIGGISLANAGEVMTSGTDGLAVVSALCSAEDPAAAAQQFLAQYPF